MGSTLTAISRRCWNGYHLAPTTSCAVSSPRVGRSEAASKQPGRYRRNPADYDTFTYDRGGRLPLTIEIDNNLVENAIRPTKLGAKNWLFIGYREAGQRVAILYTIIVNCRRLGIDTREYLEYVLTRLPGMTVSEAVALTPANWKRARQGKSQRKAA